MIRWLINRYNSRVIRKWVEKNKAEWDPVQELQKLAAVGIPYNQAVAIMNLVANMKGVPDVHNR